MSGPTFTEKHYEHMARELHRMRCSHQYGMLDDDILYVAGTLCEVFERDNSKFKRALFKEQCLSGVQHKEKPK